MDCYRYHRVEKRPAVSDRWRFACPFCDSVSLYPRQDGTSRCKWCSETFAQRYDTKHDELV